jgi:hypothetical protein
MARQKSQLKLRIIVLSLSMMAAGAMYGRASQAPVTAPPPPPVTTASIEGIAVKQGTSDPISSVELELIRVEGTTASPLSPGFLEAYNALIAAGGSGDSKPSAAIAPEVQYARSSLDGKFSFRNLKAGKYRLAALKAGGSVYPAEYGQRDPRQRGVAFPIADGQALKDLKIEMIQPAVIAGRVLDADGEPLGHVLVLALDPQYRPGGRRILNAEQIMATDERGEFRLHWLVPGPHYVAALLENPRRRTIAIDPIPPGRRGPTERAENPYVQRRTLPNGDVVEEVYGLVYYGGVTDPAQARQIDAVAGIAFPSADISLGVGKVRSWHIRGVVIDGTTGKPAGGAAVRAIPREWSPETLVLNATADMEGVFDLPGATAGGYWVFATSTSTSPGTAANISPELAAAAAAAGVSIATLTGGGGTTTGIIGIPIDVSDGHVEKLRMVTGGSFAVPGRVVVEGRAPVDNDPEMAAIRINLTRDPDIIAMPPAMAPLPPLPAGTPNTGPRPANGQVLANGTFTLHSWQGDSRVNVTGIPSSTYVKSIRIGAFDVMSDGLRLAGAPESPMEVVLATDGGTVNGTVTVGQQELFPNAVVALVPELPELRKRPEYYQSMNSDYRGAFQFKNIPPGDYKVFAWEFAPDMAWQNADFIRAYESYGKSIRVEERRQQNVSVTPIPK